MASLVTATLTEPERRALDRLVASLERELGDDLHAVWLYGSRARGEPQHPDGSDIDLLVVVSPIEGAHELVRRLADEAAKAEDVYPWMLSVFVGTPEWVANRRAIEAFYVQEVDRDKVVLAGGEVPAPPGFEVHEDGDGVRARTREYLVRARRRLDLLRRLPPGGHELAVAEAYYVVLDAARAALSEEDRFMKTHRGTWGLASESLVNTGKMSAALHARASSMQKAREDVHYGPDSPDAPLRRFTPEEGEEAVRTAEDYLRAVEELLGAPQKP